MSVMRRLLGMCGDSWPSGREIMRLHDPRLPDVRETDGYPLAHGRWLETV